MYLEIQKWGNSQGIRIPKSVLQSLGWNEKEEIQLETKDGKIVLSRPHRAPTIEELFEGWDGTYEKQDIDWGKPVGKEVW